MSANPWAVAIDAQFDTLIGGYLGGGGNDLVGNLGHIHCIKHDIDVLHLQTGPGEQTFHQGVSLHGGVPDPLRATLDGCMILGSDRLAQHIDKPIST